MESWNVSCAVTNTPIHPGEDAVAYLIGQRNPREISEKLGNPDDFWQIISASIHGSYDGFGRLDFVQTLEQASNFKNYLNLDDDKSDDDIMEIIFDEVYALRNGAVSGRLKKSKTPAFYAVNMPDYMTFPVLEFMFIQKHVWETLMKAQNTDIDGFSCIEYYDYQSIALELIKFSENYPIYQTHLMLDDDSQYPASCRAQIIFQALGPSIEGLNALQHDCLIDAIHQKNVDLIANYIEQLRNKLALLQVFEGSGLSVQPSRVIRNFYNLRLFETISSLKSHHTETSLDY